MRHWLVQLSVKGQEGSHKRSCLSSCCWCSAFFLRASTLLHSSCTSVCPLTTQGTYTKDPTLEMPTKLPSHCVSQISKLRELIHSFSRIPFLFSCCFQVLCVPVHVVCVHTCVCACVTMCFMRVSYLQEHGHLTSGFTTEENLPSLSHY